MKLMKADNLSGLAVVNKYRESCLPDEPLVEQPLEGILPGKASHKGASQLSLSGRKKSVKKVTEFSLFSILNGMGILSWGVGLGAYFMKNNNTINEFFYKRIGSDFSKNSRKVAGVFLFIGSAFIIGDIIKRNRERKKNIELHS